MTLKQKANIVINHFYELYIDFINDNTELWCEEFHWFNDSLINHSLDQFINDWGIKDIEEAYEEVLYYCKNWKNKLKKYTERWDGGTDE